MNSVKALCPAKINLTLDVIGLREDGYHNVKMIMQTVSLYDEIVVTPAFTNAVHISCNIPYVPKNEKNAAFKAALAFFDYTKIQNTGLKIAINKKIPVAAGLAGGSTDAAGVILALNYLFSTELPIKSLMEIGLSVGADVPYCIMGGTALAEGIGEALTKLLPLPDCCIVLAKPPSPVSTPSIYKMLDEKSIFEHPDTDGMIKSLSAGDLNGVSRRLFNVLESVSVNICPQISEIKRTISDCSPLGAVMSGSGPTVFGIFDSEEKAKKCKTACKKLVKEVFLVKPVDKGITIYEIDN